jgi:translation initiation factor 4E
MPAHVNRPKPKPKPKHPLENTWTMNFWHSSAWQTSAKVCTVSSIEDFWGMYNNIPKLTQCDRPNFAFFLRDIRPVWEDPVNQDGGKWMWDYPRTGRENLDRHWMTLLLLLIGETLSPPDAQAAQIFGGTIHARYGGDRMTLWTSNAASHIQRALGESLKAKMDIPGILTFKAHKDAMELNSSYNSSAKIVLI